MVDLKAQLAENLKIVFSKSKKGGGYSEYRLTHGNVWAYNQIFEDYLSYKRQEANWRAEHPDDRDSGFKKMMDVLAESLDGADYFFTLKTKLWLVSLCENERKDVKPILDLLNNEPFWKNLFNWRRMEKLTETSPVEKSEKT